MTGLAILKSNFLYEFHESDTYSIVFSFVIGWKCISFVMLFQYSTHSHAKGIIAKQLKQRL